MAAENAADRLGIVGLDLGDVQAELEARPAPRHPDDSIAKDLGGQLLTIDSCGNRNSRVRVQMINMCRIDKAMHRGVDRGCGAALSMQAVVEGGDHFVLTFHTGVDAHQLSHSIKPQHGEPGLLQGAQIPAGTLNPDELHRLTGYRISLGAFG
jgi:hypothetical protein